MRKFEGIGMAFVSQEGHTFDGNTDLQGWYDVVCMRLDVFVVVMFQDVVQHKKKLQNAGDMFTNIVRTHSRNLVST